MDTGRHAGGGVEIYDRVARTGVAERLERYAAMLGRWYDFHVSRTADGAPGGARDGARRVAIVFQDVTARKHAEAALRESEERQAFLLKLGDALRAEPDADAVADRSIRMLIEYMRLDRSYIVSYRLEDDRADLVHQRGNDTVPPLPDTFVLSDYPAAFRATFDQTLVIEDELERQGLSEAERRNSARLGMRAMVAATLRRGEGRPLWSMVAISSLPRRWTQGDIALVEEVTERTWAAMDRARAEAALRDSEERQVFLLKLSDTLRGEAEERQIERVALDLLAEQLSADRAYITISDYGKGETEVPAEVRRGELPPLSGIFRHSDFPESARSVNAGTLVVEDVGQDAHLSELNRRSFEAVRIGALIGVGLRKGDGDIFWTLAVARGARGPVACVRP